MLAKQESVYLRCRRTQLVVMANCTTSIVDGDVGNSVWKSPQQKEIYIDDQVK